MAEAAVAEAVMDNDVADLVVDEIMERLKAFDAAIEANQVLEIDGLSVDGAPCDKVTQESRIKVVNHQTRQAYEVTVDAIIQTPLKDLIKALETGEFMKCFGITRIN